ncbi:MAG TPA: nucleoside transporter C-terminal domain-containing protein [Micropepsaceae bacterium]|jgi:CNT family concentrative nucleoside transporter|nr:nucleoside transporter C-terminal domain-containing protein [Micropepsaceae bacterium]
MPWLQLQSAFGLVVLVLVAWALSENRRAAFSWRLIASTLGLQIAIALVLLEVPMARTGLYSLNHVVDALSSATNAGTSFVFGYVGGAAPPFEVSKPQNLNSLAFQALPLVLVMSALSALLWHWRVLPIIVKGFAYVLQKTLSIGGAVGLGSASTVFLGMIEAPLLIRPYLAQLTRAELFMLFTVGLSTVAGTVMVLYATVLEPVVPGALGHILVASFISLPAAILVARLMVPGESSTPAEAYEGAVYRSSMDAIARGTEDGLKLFLGIVAMLLVMVALVALADIVIGVLPPVGGAPVTVERIFGWLFQPLVWLYGIPAAEAADAGALLGTKTILNEFIAYLKLAALPNGVLSPRSRLIMLYAMCGFANLGSVGIMIAGVSGMVPQRRDEVVELALKALVAGTLASGMTGAVVGLLPVASLGAG